MSHKRPQLQIPLLLALACAVLATAATTAQGQDSKTKAVELYDYVVQKGDSCAGIARRELGDRKGYRDIHRYNDLGPLPHRLKPGRVLRLPRASRTPDARLDSRVGKVEYRKAAESAWDAAAKGMDIFRAWRVWSHEESTAVLVFQDDSVISLRNNTIVVIYGPTATTGKRKLVRAELKSGSLRSRLAQLEGGLIVDTESSSMELQNGSAVIAASSDSKRSTVSNHEGPPVAVRSRTRGKRRGAAVAVGPGKGSWVEAGKAPAPPVDLPTPPTMRQTPALKVGLASAGVSLTGSWAPVDRAEKYRVEVATDPNVRIVAAAFEVTKNVTSFEARGLASGQYYVSVSTIDDKGLESTPSKRQMVEIALLEELPLEGTEKSALAQGSQLRAPENVTCSANRQASVNTVPLLEPGTVEIECTGKAGTKSDPIALEVAGSTLSFEDNAQTTFTLLQGQERELLVASDPPLSKDAKLRIDAPPGTAAQIVSVGEPGIAVRVTTTLRSPARAPLRIFRETAAGEFLLATLDLTIKAQPVAPAPVRSRRVVAFGLGAGAFFSGLEDDIDGSHQAPLLGARLRVQLSGALELEAEANLARRSASRSHMFAANQLLLAWREQLGATFHARARLGPTLWHNSDPEAADATSIGAALGLGLERRLGPGWLRLDASAFAFGDASKRLSAGLSYDWKIDFAPKRSQ